MTTISSRGRLSRLIAFPKITSDSPFEYTLAVSNVWIPSSYLIQEYYEQTARKLERKGYLRKFNMFDTLLLIQNPFLPLGRAVTHRS